MANGTCDIGLIGLAVMGENLVLNMESRGYTVAVFNRTTSKVDEFVGGRGQGKTHFNPTRLELRYTGDYLLHSYAHRPSPLPLRARMAS